MPSRTAWLAVTGWVRPRASVWRASSTMSRSSSARSTSVTSSTCRSTGRSLGLRDVEHAGALGPRVGCEVRTAAHHVDAAGGGRGDQLRRRLVAREQADLQRDPAAQPLAQPDQRVDGAEGVGPGVQVDVGADRRDAARRRSGGSRRAPARSMSARSIVGSRTRQLSQAATRSLPTPGGSRGAVRALSRWACGSQAAGRTRQPRASSSAPVARGDGDGAAVEQHVAERAVGQPDAAERRDGRPGEVGRAVGGPYLL